MPQDFFLPLLILLMVSTVAVLVMGLVTMAKGGKGGARRSNKLMIARVVLQGLAVVTLLAMVGLKALG